MKPTKEVLVDWRPPGGKPKTQSECFREGPVLPLLPDTLLQYIQRPVEVFLGDDQRRGEG